MRYDKWDISGFDRDKAAALCGGDINPLVAVLLASRGITDPCSAKEYSDIQSLPYYDPFLLTDMDKAVARINQAVESNEVIAVYGDYDVDGMTSAALLASWLETKRVKYILYIPGRFDEGYGLHCGALDTLKEQGARLVITVDCGITAVSEAEHAKETGLDLIITDHHECRETLPAAAAVIDPKRPDCAYPYKALAGVGVVFKLICALEGGMPSGDIFDRSVQLAALGTVADVMPITGENRKIVSHGLHLMNTNPGPGLSRLILDACQSTDKISAATISYALAPRLNAAGRMSDPLLSVKLLLSNDAAQAGQLVEELGRLNDERRKLEQNIYDCAIEKLGTDKPQQPVILAGEGWYQGVTGIVASKMADRFKLPVIIISIDEDGIGHGSCRSFGTFSVYDALCSCSDILDTYGGHNMAAGVTLDAANIDKLRGHITRYYNKHVKSAPRMSLNIDFEVEKPKLLTARNIEALDCLKPFGTGNPPPCLCMTETTVTDIVPLSGGKHVKLKIEKAGQAFDCIFFSVSPGELGVFAGDTADIAFEPQINEFRGYRNVQLQLVDIKSNKRTA